MWPTLISFGPISLHSFGVLVFLGLFFGGFKLWQRAKEEGWDEAAVMDSWLFAAVSSLIVGRLGFIFNYWGEFGGSVYKMIFLTKFPGLSAEGAWLGAAAALLILALKKRFDFWHFIEAAVPALLIVEIFSRLGSFLAGTNLGKAAPAGLGLTFPGIDQPRWPVQLLWALALGLIYLLINYWEKHYRSFSWAKEGFLAAVYLILLGGLKICLGFLEESSAFGGWWGAGLSLAGGLILIFRSGITIKAPAVKAKEPKRKKGGFDYV
ncbi:MAG: Prolipoprotein diacylglyceryl transferase [Candidatus Beckwithbacteria bacterium GW2011_GWC2_47_9]|uniref:Prolipoprotein diacylglyceryl transferase n=3 Tax=Candidatus Beckwithiibacteriota TaxID=1752726 RepID=A0A0G1U287_9BACT|nr:MAG: Prolipoprotein diacylglyceryl transferase [Candidatus Beckwithbacteria bacterium GW2011_GWC2_47_9]OGD55239.1 MAG: hypothetical protein A3E73_01855 [Candidatus Beckwithbacteria bacterium RIFCSPHIGHO2_12_FULL_47_17]OGD61671.1 MAG: hypothetical protein A3I57_02875 [Candidatus Beckwithbacteria bacterium RIFCSPLOWO2_02_FULL_47_23]